MARLFQCWFENVCDSERSESGSCSSRRPAGSPTTLRDLEPSRAEERRQRACKMKIPAPRFTLGAVRGGRNSRPTVENRSIVTPSLSFASVVREGPYTTKTIPPRGPRFHCSIHHSICSILFRSATNTLLNCLADCVHSFAMNSNVTYINLNCKCILECMHTSRDPVSLAHCLAIYLGMRLLQSVIFKLVVSLIEIFRNMIDTWHSHILY